MTRFNITDHIKLYTLPGVFTFKCWLTSSILEQIGQGHISALEKLIDAYAMIGEAMPRFDKLSAAFKDDKEFQQMMSLFYEDILDFHRRAYKFFRQRGRLKFSMVNSKIFGRI